MFIARYIGDYMSDIIVAISAVWRFDSILKVSGLIMNGFMMQLLILQVRILRTKLIRC